MLLVHANFLPFGIRVFLHCSPRNKFTEFTEFTPNPRASSVCSGDSGGRSPVLLSPLPHP